MRATLIAVHILLGVGLVQAIDWVKIHLKNK